MMTGDSGVTNYYTTINGELYIISTSSDNNYGNYPAYRAFQYINWQASVPWYTYGTRYRYDTGQYSGTLFITNVDGVDVAGEYLQVQMGNTHTILRYGIRPDAYNGLVTKETVRNFQLVGSNDGTTWTLLDARTDMVMGNPWVADITSFFNTQKQIAVKYVRLVITAVVGQVGYEYYYSATVTQLVLIEPGVGPCVSSISCPSPGALRCTPDGTAVCCVAGQYFIEASITSTQYNTDGSSTACQPCLAGTFSVDGMGTSCAACPSGASSLTGSSACQCPSGHIHDPATNLCNLRCVPGEYVNAGNCVQCESGTYSSMTDASACISCDAGTYTATAKAVACATCPANSYCPTTSAVVPCPATTSSPAGSNSYAQCMCPNTYLRQATSATTTNC
jgi:hypothetical protein